MALTAVVDLFLPQSEKCGTERVKPHQTATKLKHKNPNNSYIQN